MKSKILAMILIISCSITISCTKKAASDTVPPAAVNVSAERLERIDTLINTCVANHWINGAVAYIARDGKTVYYKSFGLDDVEKQKPMTRDAIFRIASQTKAITSVAIMMLFEEGKLLLDDPVSKYISEFANSTVIDKFNLRDTSFTTLPALREITIRDLLTHTSGIDYAVIGSPMMVAVYKKAGIPVGFESRPILLGDHIKKLGTLPLAHQPGDRFTYGLNCDVLGYLVEVISGMPFDQFLTRRLFEPLGMKDTYFYLPADKQNRLVSVYTEDPSHKPVKWTSAMSPDVDANYPLVKGTYFSGGAGLSSTVADYGAFLQMLLNEGEYKGKRILSGRTVELMTSNQIGNLMLGTNKFGLGFEITTPEGQAKLGVTEGSFAWGGFFGTTYWVDPEEKLVCQLYCQQSPISQGDMFEKFRVLVYAALDD